jgi:enterochelin esterase-like enzyme
MDQAAKAQRTKEFNMDKQDGQDGRTILGLAPILSILFIHVKTLGFSWCSLWLCGLLIHIRPAAQSCDSTVVGTLDIVKFDSKVFGNTRMLRVLLPPEYRLPMNRAHRYPVLYLNDGQNLFDVCTSIFNHEEWRVDETVPALIKAGEIPPIIVVGIDNAGRRLRPHEYLPYPDDTLSPPDPNPQGQKYPDFLLNEVIPFVEDHYRVRGGPGNRVLGGSSYGAGVALYTAIARPGAFAALLLESPSVYAAGYQLFKDAAAVQEWPRRVYIGTGTVQEPVEDVAKLADLFRRAGFDDHHLRVIVQEGGQHSESWWAKRLPEALKFLFAN